MIEKTLSLILCGVITMCLVSCNANQPQSAPHISDEIQQSNTASTSSSSASTESTKTETTTSTSESNTTTTSKTNTTSSTKATTASASKTKPTQPAKPFFETDNIVRITFYINYGSSKGSDVPAEDMAAILKWLSSFTITKEITDLIPPGTGFYIVELEYVDGTVVKQNLDTTSIDGIGYYIDGDTTPDCFWEIIKKIPLE